jgi:hypothetical protein
LRGEYGIEPVAVTGPATDNLVGTQQIEQRLGVPAVNARTDAARLAEVVRAAVAARGGGPARPVDAEASA